MSRDDRAVVFDVQRFSLHDGPGIRTVVFFKGCTLDCAWCHNPEAVRPAPELAYWAERCVSGCRECIAACPEQALSDCRDGRVDWSRCTHCGLCAPACPADALVVIGRDSSVEDLLAEILRDRAFYAESRGGVTFSGGEPALHSAFLRRLLPMAKAKGLHLALETAGACPWNLLEPLLDHLDLVLYDLKVMDSGEHRRLTGNDNADVHANLRRLVARGAAVEVRMPVVPGCNTGDANVEATARFLAEMGKSRLTLLPYNHLWEAKLPALDTPRTAMGLRPPAADFYDELSARFGRHGIQASC